MKANLAETYAHYQEAPTEDNQAAFLREVARYTTYLLFHEQKLQQQTKQDLVQDTVIRVWKNVAEFDGRSSIVTWIHKIACNARYDHFTRHKQEEQIPEHFDIAGTFREPVDGLPAWLLDDPIARDVMDDMPVAEIQKKHGIAKWAYYRHLKALGKRMTAQNLEIPVSA